MTGNSNITEVIVLFTPSELIGLDLRGSAAIVIDVLRGSTTLIRAFKNGAARVIPSNEIEEARSMANEWPTGEYVLCAERNGIRVDGFTLGNSPFEYEPELIGGKDIIYSSTNGSKAMLASYDADRVLIGTFNNLSAAVDSIGPQRRIVLVCSGKMGRFALEDAVCAGMFVNAFLRIDQFGVALNDGARTAKFLFDYYHRDILRMLQESSHGNYLLGLGCEKDLELAATVDCERIVPELALTRTHFFATLVPRNEPGEDALGFHSPVEPVFRTTQIISENEIIGF